MTQQHSPPREIVEMSRRIFEGLISATLHTTNTTGTCMYGSLLVSMLLEKFSGVGTSIAGGDGLDDGGILTAEGMKGHYWVVANVHGTFYVIDITADQFGMDKVIFKRLENAPEYVEGQQVIVDEHLAEMIKQITDSHYSAEGEGRFDG